MRVIDFHKKQLTPTKLLRLKLKQHKYVFLTGAGGCGKTHLIEKYISTLKDKTLVLGSTNLSAIHLKGSTVHRIFKLYDIRNLKQLEARLQDKVEKLQLKNPILTRQKAIEFIHKDLIHILKNIDTIIIEEISLLGKLTFELFFYQLSKYGGKKIKNIHILLVGDFYQLEAIKQPLTFQSELFNNFYTIELQEVKRTRAESFIDVLKQIRIGVLDDYGKDMLQYFQEKYESANKNKLKEESIQLFAVNSEVKEHNDYMMEQIKSKETFTSGYEISYKHPEVNNYLIDSFLRDSNFEAELSLKKGAKVVFIATDEDKGYYNGLTGTVKNFGVDVNLDPYVVVQTSKKTYLVNPYPFQLLNYIRKPNGKLRVQKMLEIKALPLKLAFALSIHRSQGMTISDKVVINCDRIFAPHQFYVAISRCAEPKKLYINGSDIFKHIRINPLVKQLYAKLKKDNRLEKWYGY